MVKGGGVQIEILKKNPGIYLYSGLRKNVQGGGGAIRNPKYNAGIDFYSGFRETSHGGGVQYEILKKCAPPPPPYLKTWIRHCLGIVSVVMVVASVIVVAFIALVIVVAFIASVIVVAFIASVIVVAFIASFIVVAFIAPVITGPWRDRWPCRYWWLSTLSERSWSSGGFSHFLPIDMLWRPVGSFRATLANYCSPVHRAPIVGRVWHHWAAALF